MLVIKIAIVIGKWLRRYGVLFLLLGSLGFSFYIANTVGTRPMPQFPADGYEVERGKITLQWNKGTIEAPIKLQISKNDPFFKQTILDKKMNNITYTFNKLERGQTYYWRLVQENSIGPVVSFIVSNQHVKL